MFFNWPAVAYGGIADVDVACWSDWSSQEELPCGQRGSSVYEEISSDEEEAEEAPPREESSVPPPPPSPPRQRVTRPCRPRSAGAIGGPLMFRRGGPYVEASPRFYHLVTVRKVSKLHNRPFTLTGARLINVPVASHWGYVLEGINYRSQKLHVL